MTELSSQNTILSMSVTELQNRQKDKQVDRTLTTRARAVQQNSKRRRGRLEVHRVLEEAECVRSVLVRRL